MVVAKSKSPEHFKSFSDMCVFLARQCLDLNYVSDVLIKYAKSWNREEMVLITSIYILAVVIYLKGVLTLYQLLMPSLITPIFSTLFMVWLVWVTDEWKVLEKQEASDHFILQAPSAFITGMFLAITERWFLYTGKSNESWGSFAFDIFWLFIAVDFVSYAWHRWVHAKIERYAGSAHEEHHLGGPRVVSLFTAGIGIVDNLYYVPLPFSIAAFIHPPSVSAYYCFIVFTAFNSYMTHCRIYLTHWSLYFFGCYKYHHQLHHLDKNINFGFTRFFDILLGTCEVWDAPKSKKSFDVLSHAFSHVEKKHLHLTGLDKLTRAQETPTSKTS